MKADPALSLFDPPIIDWFTGTLGSPTDIQVRAWPEIAAGNNVLISAPTGSGKTLTAFLWSINQWLTGNWTGNGTRVLYVSPMKALNNDVHKNLLKPLTELRASYEEAGKEFIEIRVLTRSGDTPQADRRRMLRHPPEILITTPESLNIMISSKHGRRLFECLDTVILDEIHAVVGDKRGVHLMSAVDRLVPLSGEFQRIALSATIKPQDKVADFIGGYTIEGSPLDPVYRKRKVSIVRSNMKKKLTASIRFSGETHEKKKIDNTIWPQLVDALKVMIHRHNSTLIFANSRRMTEKVARLINEDEHEDLAYAHHGSLAKEIRLTVESKLKGGDLKAIVATNSLELGIDIGNLDQVLLIQCPFSVSSAIQRIGRSGHGVGETSSGVLYPTHGRDLINAAVMVQCVLAQDIEPVEPVSCPLDVLAQVILAMTGVETWDLDGLYAFLRTNAAFHVLSRRQFELVLDMLAGRYADTRIRELKPRVTIDRIDNTVKARAGSLMLVNMTGGTIPDRGYYDLRLVESRTKIGELDEEFVWERRVGETFAMGAQNWRIHRITHNDVDVVPVEGKPGIIPFWRAEARNRDFHFSQKVACFLEDAERQLSGSEEQFRDRLCHSCFMDDVSAQNLIEYLKLQKQTTGTDLPHRNHLVIEHFNDPSNKADSKQVLLHTLWGGRINRPFAMSLASVWEEAHQYPLETFADDDSISLLLPYDFDVADLLKLINVDNVEDLLRRQLERTGFFGAMFRENAGRALLLPKGNFQKRMPLWLNRLRSRNLLDAVTKADDFPVTLETWRTCLQDVFDLQNMKTLLEELASGQIRVSQTNTQSASPFAQGLIWRHTNKYMYEDDTPSGGQRTSISDDLFREVTGSAHLRPKLEPESIKALEQKLHRTVPGYAPATGEDVLDWVKERLLIPEDEWNNLLSVIISDQEIKLADILSNITNKILKITLPGAAVSTVCAVENLPKICQAFSVERNGLSIHPIVPGVDESRIENAVDYIFQKSQAVVDNVLDDERRGSIRDLLVQWLAYYGPVSEPFIEANLGLANEPLREILQSLEDEQQIIIDLLSKEAHVVEICNRDNLEILLRLARRERQPAFQALPAEYLPLFLAEYQGLTKPGESVEDLQERLDQLFGVCAPASAWEEFILPTRMNPYYTAWMDSLMQSGQICWFGCGDKRISLAFDDDLELFMSGGSTPAKDGDEDFHGHNDTDGRELIPGPEGRYSLFDITKHSGLNSGEAIRRLWGLSWLGKISNDSFAVLRDGILNRFTPSELKDRPARGRRRQFNRWKSSRSLAGSWYSLTPGSEEIDNVEELEVQKDRIRQLLKRYGVLFSSLLDRELPLLRWKSVFRTLRLMELSGEVLSGYFFEGIRSPQFISHEAFRILDNNLSDDVIYWLNATDPASLCGTKVDGLSDILPSRLISTHLVFHGTKLVLVSRRMGKDVEILVPPDHTELLRYLSVFKAMTGRQFNPQRTIQVEMINHEDATLSPYEAPLKAFGFSKNYKTLELLRRY